jgi:hypothetical protein
MKKVFRELNALIIAVKDEQEATEKTERSKTREQNVSKVELRSLQRKTKSFIHSVILVTSCSNIALSRRCNYQCGEFFQVDARRAPKSCEAAESAYSLARRAACRSICSTGFAKGSNAASFKASPKRSIRSAAPPATTARRD